MFSNQILNTGKQNAEERRILCEMSVHRFMLDRCHFQLQPAPLHRASPWIKEWQKINQINKRAGRNSGKKGDMHDAQPSKICKKSGAKMQQTVQATKRAEI
jgi:hypothetical protein